MDVRRLLIVEDDPGLQSQLKWSFEGVELEMADTRSAAIAALRRFEPQVVLLDLGLPPDAEGATEGLACLDEMLKLAPHVKVIVVTGNDDRANAVAAVGRGAYDFYQKPVDSDELNLITQRAFGLYELEQENRRLVNEMGGSPLSGVVASSPQMLRVCQMVERVATVDATALVLGESGTGKELIAKAIHQLSGRAKGPFVAINCAAIPENLLESELFGYEKGAFTGAAKRTIGKVESASKGTLFLDEIGDMPLPLQAKMLRFLQERVIERLGGREEIPVDVRVVCATHRDLQGMIASGEFREDLFYRIGEVKLNLPSLRERTADAVLLARVFLSKFNQEFARNIKGYSPQALTAIESHAWPGNVRELENRVKSAVIMAMGQYITPEDLELSSEEQSEDAAFNLKEVRDHAEYQAVVRALSLSDNNISRTAELLGVTRPTLYSLLSKHEIQTS